MTKRKTSAANETQKKNNDHKYQNIVTDVADSLINDGIKIIDDVIKINSISNSVLPIDSDCKKKKYLIETLLSAINAQMVFYAVHDTIRYDLNHVAVPDHKEYNLEFAKEFTYMNYNLYDKALKGMRYIPKEVQYKNFIQDATIEESSTRLAECNREILQVVAENTIKELHPNIEVGESDNKKLSRYNFNTLKGVFQQKHLNILSNGAVNPFYLKSVTNAILAKSSSPKKYLDILNLVTQALVKIKIEQNIVAKEIYHKVYGLQYKTNKGYATETLKQCVDKACNKMIELVESLRTEIKQMRGPGSASLVAQTVEFVNKYKAFPIENWGNYLSLSTGVEFEILKKDICNLYKAWSTSSNLSQKILYTYLCFSSAQEKLQILVEMQLHINDGYVILAQAKQYSRVLDKKIAVSGKENEVKSSIEQLFPDGVSQWEQEILQYYALYLNKDKEDNKKIKIEILHSLLPQLKEELQTDTLNTSPSGEELKKKYCELEKRHEQLKIELDKLKKQDQNIIKEVLEQESTEAGDKINDQSYNAEKLLKPKKEVEKAKTDNKEPKQESEKKNKKEKKKSATKQELKEEKKEGEDLEEDKKQLLTSADNDASKQKEKEKKEEEQLQMLKQQLEDAEQSNNTYKQKLEQAETDNEAYKQKLEQAEKDNEESKQQYEQKIKDLNQELTKLQEKSKNQTIANSQQLEANEKLKEKNQQLEDKLKNLDTKATESKALQELNTKYEELEKELDAQKKKNAELENRNEKLLAGEQHVRQTNNDLMQQNENLENQLRVQTQLRFKVETDLKEMQQKDQLEKCGLSEKKVGAKTAAEVNERVAKHKDKKEYKGLGKEKAKLNEQVKNLNTELTNLESSIKEAKQEKQGLDSQLEDARTKLGELQKARDNLHGADNEIEKSESKKGQQNHTKKDYKEVSTCTTLGDQTVQYDKLAAYNESLEQEVLELQQLLSTHQNHGKKQEMSKVIQYPNHYNFKKHTAKNKQASTKNKKNQNQDTYNVTPVDDFPQLTPESPQNTHKASKITSKTHGAQHLSSVEQGADDSKPLKTKLINKHNSYDPKTDGTQLTQVAKQGAGDLKLSRNTFNSMDKLKHMELSNSSWDASQPQMFDASNHEQTEFYVTTYSGLESNSSTDV